MLLKFEQWGFFGGGEGRGCFKCQAVSNAMTRLVHGEKWEYKMKDLCTFPGCCRSYSLTVSSSRNRPGVTVQPIKSSTRMSSHCLLCLMRAAGSGTKWVVCLFGFVVPCVKSRLVGGHQYSQKNNAWQWIHTRPHAILAECYVLFFSSRNICNLTQTFILARALRQVWRQWRPCHGAGLGLGQCGIDFFFNINLLYIKWPINLY